MKLKLNNTRILIVILTVAFTLRVFLIGSIPVSLNWDEAAFGYNAYALGTDGKDEFGQFLPYAYLESFGDFKPVLYAYITMLSVKIFGLTEFSVRFPSAVFGTLTVILTYLLTKNIFYKTKEKETLALISAGVLAVSPWHINLSRGAYEANVATFFIVLGVVAFLSAVHGRKWMLVLSALSFVASVYTFNTARVVTPVLVIVLGLCFIRNLWKEKLATVVAFVIGLAVLLPTVPFLLSPQAALRFNEVNIFSDISVVERTNQQITNDNNAVWSKVLHNRRLAYGVEYLKHYMDTFSPAFLFIEGDENLRFGTRDMGILYLWEGPLLFLGLILLFRKREGYWWILPVYILIGILPAATARETPHALRLLTLIPTFQILIAYGALASFSWLSSRKAPLLMKRSSFVGFGIVVSVSFFYYLYGYYVFYPTESARAWGAGYKESVVYVNSVSDEYDQVSITTNMGRPYIYYLFYAKTPPETFRSSTVVHRDAFGFVNVQGFGKYTFHDNPLSVATDSGRVLYLDVSERVPDNAIIRKEFFLPDGTSRLTAFTL